MSNQSFALLVPSSAWRLNLALGHKRSFFFLSNQILGTLDFAIFTGSEHRALYDFQSTDIQIVAKAQIKGRATHHDQDDWNRLRAHIARNYQWCGVALVLKLWCYIGIFQFIYYFLHGWSCVRICLQASPYQAAKHIVRYKHDLFFLPCRIWQFPDAHFTKKNTKAVDINLKTIVIYDFLPEYSLFTLLVSGILIRKELK